MLNWKLMAEFYPHVGDIVVVAKDGEQDKTAKWVIGQFLQSDDGKLFGILADFNNSREIVLIAEKYKYWCSLCEGGYKLPPDFEEEDLLKYYEAFRKLILSYEYRFLAIARLTKLAAGKVYPLDIYFDGIYNRSLSLIYATITLLDAKNYMAAAHIVRLHLDNFLRLRAAWMVTRPHEFVSEVMDGKSVRNLKDRNGIKMTDSHLCKEASKEFPWIQGVYDKACGFIHFSGTHILSGQKIVGGEERTIQTFIGKADWDNVTDKSRIEVLAIMAEISDCILKYAYGWARTKMEENNLERLRGELL